MTLRSVLKAMWREWRRVQAMSRTDAMIAAANAHYTMQYQLEELRKIIDYHLDRAWEQHAEKAREEERNGRSD